MEKIGKLNQDIWDIIIKHSELTSVTNLARAGRRFNNYVGLDFHKLCVVNHIFRLPGESWADAFADAHRRLWIVAESFTDEVLYLRRMVSIDFKSNSHLVVFSYNSTVIVCSLDFSSTFVKVFRFEKNVNGIDISTDQKYIIINVWFNDTYVYELATGRPLFTQARKRMTFNSSVFKYHTFENIVEEVLSTKTTFMDNMRELEHTTEHYCARVVQDKLLVYDVSKGVQYELPLNPSFGKVCTVLFLVCSNCVLISYVGENRRWPCQVYHILTGRLMLQDPESVYDILSPFLLRCCRGNVYKLDPFSGIWNRAASSVQTPCTLPSDIAPNFIVYEASPVAKADLKRARKYGSRFQKLGINQRKVIRLMYYNTKIYVDKQEGLTTNDGEQQSLVLTERDNRDSYPDEKQDRWMTYKCSFLEEKSRSKWKWQVGVG